MFGINVLGALCLGFVGRPLVVLGWLFGCWLGFRVLSLGFGCCRFWGGLVLFCGFGYCSMHFCVVFGGFGGWCGWLVLDYELVGFGLVI